MMNKTAMELTHLQMVHGTKVISREESSTAKENQSTKQEKRMISSSILDIGKTVNPTAKGRLIIKMEIIMKAAFKEGLEMDLASLSLIKLSNTKVNGKIQFFKEMENSIATGNYSSKANFKMGLSTVQENTNIKMEIISKECILKIKKEDMEIIIFLKEEFYNRNLIPYLLKYPRLSYPMDQFTLDSN